MANKSRKQNSPKSAQARSVAKTIRKTPRKDRRRSRVPPSLVLASSPHVRRYIQSLHDDTLVAGLQLPCTNFYGGYQQTHHRATLQLIAGSAGLTSGVIVNPWMLWTDQINIDRITNNAAVAQPFYTLYTTKGSTPLNRVFGSADYIEDTMTNQIPTSATTACTGYARCQGVKFTITYTGTELNKGGQIVALHNPRGKCLAAVDDARTGAGLNPLTSTDFTTYANMYDSGSIHRIGNRFSFVWRPNNLDFQQVSSSYLQPEESVAALNAANVEAVSKGVFTSFDEFGKVTPLGWITGFALQAAAGTAGQPLPYIVEVEAIYDLSLASMETSQASYMEGRIRAHAHPQDAAAIHNALADIHHTRNQSTLATVENLGTSALKKAASGAVEALGARLAGMMA